MAHAWSSDRSLPAAILSGGVIPTDSLAIDNIMLCDLHVPSDSHPRNIGQRQSRQQNLPSLISFPRKFCILALL